MHTKITHVVAGCLTAMVGAVGCSDEIRDEASHGEGDGGISAQPERLLGERGEMGSGRSQTYVELDRDGAPSQIGVTFTSGLLEDLPTHMNADDPRRCFDTDGDGSIAAHDECVGDYEIALDLPDEVHTQLDVPFQWVSVNWNPLGHLPPANPAWGVPHFDFHFYTAEEATVTAIRPGSCGHLMDCEDYARAQIPVPPEFVPPNHQFSAAVPAMGQHMLDTAAPELATPPEAPFTHSFLFGAYDGHVIFYEPMIEYEFLRRSSDACRDIPLPQAWELSGYYPTRACIRTSPADAAEHSVSLEDFVYREAQ